MLGRKSKVEIAIESALRKLSLSEGDLLLVSDKVLFQNLVALEWKDLPKGVKLVLVNNLNDIKVTNGPGAT